MASYCVSGADSNRVIVSLSVKTMIYVFAKSFFSFCSVCKNVTENKWQVDTYSLTHFNNVLPYDTMYMLQLKIFFNPEGKGNLKMKQGQNFALKIHF